MIQHKITSIDKCSVILCFVRKSVEERLLVVVDSHSATGADLCELMEGVLANQNIDVSKCISDSTDGASNRSGQYKGFTAFLEKESSGRIYAWCYAHVVNLVLCDATTTNYVSIEQVAVFFRESYLQMDIWKEQMSQMHGRNTQCKLNLIGATKWWSKHACLQNFFRAFEDGPKGTCCDVVRILYSVSRSEKLSIKARFDAKTILDNIIRYQHILIAMTYLRIMEKTSALSICRLLD